MNNVKDIDLLPDSKTTESGRFTTSPNPNRQPSGLPPFRLDDLVTSPLGQKTREEVLLEYRGKLGLPTRRQS